MTRSRTYNPELARHDPTAFLNETARHMTETTELGALAWNAALENGTLDLSKAEVRPDQWVSFMRANGELVLGAQPMSEREKNDLLYMGESLSYPDEVSMRLLHELGHGATYVAQNDPNMHQLNVLTHGVRKRTPDAGLSAIGSLDFYNTTSQKGFEDTAELLRMRMVSNDHLEGYLALLSDPRFQNARDAHGLATLEDTSYLREVIDEAVIEGLTLR